MYKFLKTSLCLCAFECMYSVCKLSLMPACLSPAYISVSVYSVEYCDTHCPSSFRETTVTKKTFVPSAPIGAMTGGHSVGNASTPQWISYPCLTATLNPVMDLCVMSATTMMSARSTAPAAQRAKATTSRVTETLQTAQPPPQLPLPAPQMTRRPAGAPPAAPPQTRHPPWTPRSVDRPPPVEVVEDHQL